MKNIQCMHRDVDRRSSSTFGTAMRISPQPLTLWALGISCLQMIRMAMEFRHGMRCSHSCGLIRFFLLVICMTNELPFVVQGLCPNACSGHGFCGEFLMCFCFRNYRGPACSERVCPYGHAFITTPQGDLNFDGDRADNSWKRLSVVAQTFKINTNTITLSGALKTGTQAIGESKVYKNELAPGDFIRVKDQVMRVEECRDGTQLVKSATDFTHACNVIVVSWGVGLYSASNSIANPHAGHAHSFRFGGQAWSELSGYNIYKFVLTQYRPEGTWEQWPGDFYGSGTLSDVEDEGHFYMECSNRGKCNRAWGQCECFPGYTGTACTRQACTCSGHGTCETVDELRKLDPVF